MTVHRMLGRSIWFRRLNTHQKCVVFGPVGLSMNAFKLRNKSRSWLCCHAEMLRIYMGLLILSASL